MVRHYQNAQIKEDVNGELQLTFTSLNLPENPAHQLLVNEEVVIADGKEFIIKQAKNLGKRKSIIAISTFFEVGDTYAEAIYGGTRTLQEFLQFILGSTTWSFTTDVRDSRYLPNFGEDNRLALFHRILEEFDCEYYISGNKTIHVTNRIGYDANHDYVFRYGVNVKTLELTVDTTNLKTQITGYGADDLKVVYTSPNASTFGIRVAEPLRDTNYKTAQDLGQRLKNELTDEPDIMMRVDVVELTNRTLGEQVHLVYEPMDNLVMQTRVIEQVKTIRGNQWVTQNVVLGTKKHKAKSMTDRLTNNEINVSKDRKNIFSRIEQTDVLIHVSVTELNRSIAEIEVSVGKVEIQVSDLERDTNASIYVLANNINLKVDKAGVISAINVSPERIKIQSQNLDIIGAVNVLSDIKCNLGVINTGTLNSINIYSANINIQENIYVGDKIYLGATRSWSNKEIIFNQSSKITGGGGLEEINLEGTVTNFKARTTIVSSGVNQFVVDAATFMVNEATRTFGLVKTTGQMGLHLNPSRERLYIRNGSGQNLAYVETVPQ